MGENANEHMLTSLLIHNFKNSLHSSVSSFTIVDPAHDLNRPNSSLGCLSKPVSAIQLLHVRERADGNYVATKTKFAWLLA
jgi:hypothetical protein